jgi:hypothetical protein
MPAVALGDVAQLDTRLAPVALGVLRRERARPFGPRRESSPPRHDQHGLLGDARRSGVLVAAGGRAHEPFDDLPRIHRASLGVMAPPLRKRRG